MEGAKGLLLALATRGPRTRDAAYEQFAQDVGLGAAHDTYAWEGVALDGGACEDALRIELTLCARVVCVEDASDQVHVAEDDALEGACLEEAVLEGYIAGLICTEGTRFEDAGSEGDIRQCVLDEASAREARTNNGAAFQVELFNPDVLADVPGVIAVDVGQVDGHLTRLHSAQFVERVELITLQEFSQAFCIC